MRKLYPIADNDGKEYFILKTHFINNATGVPTENTVLF